MVVKEELVVASITYIKLFSDKPLGKEWRVLIEITPINSQSINECHIVLMSSSFLKVFPLLHGNLLLPCLTESQAALTSLKTTEGQTIIFI